MLIKARQNVFFWLTGFIVYATSFEILAKMSKTSPYLPYELGKYLLLVLLIFGILRGCSRGHVGWFMLALLIPGLLIDRSGLVNFKYIIANALGPINVALAIVYFKGQSLSKEEFITILRLLTLPLISVVAFVIIKTPEFDDLKFKLGANFETAGAFGTNQVSTVLGVGAFLVLLFWKNNWLLSGYRWIDGLLAFAFIFRGLLTFSRGGMIGGLVGFLVIIIFKDRYVEEKFDKGLIRKTVLAIGIFAILFFTFQFADKKTGGMLSLRYQGETAGTYYGRKKMTINTFTSNRFNIINDDLALWNEYPIFGAGVGASRNLRLTTKNIAAHTEFSRLLSEHGIPGLIIIFILVFLGLEVYRRRKYIPIGPVLLALYVIAIFTTFHAATRTYISPLLIGLALIAVSKNKDKNVISGDELNTLHR